MVCFVMANRKDIADRARVTHGPASAGLAHVDRHPGSEDSTTSSRKYPSTVMRAIYVRPCAQGEGSRERSSAPAKNAGSRATQGRAASMRKAGGARRGTGARPGVYANTGWWLWRGRRPLLMKGEPGTGKEVFSRIGKGQSAVRRRRHRRRHAQFE